MLAVLPPDPTRSLAPSQEPSAPNTDRERRERWACLKAHIPPRYTLTYAVGGSFNRLRASDRKQGPVGGGRRGAVTTFSPQARRRFLEYWSKLNRAAIGSVPPLMTLTYPERFPTAAADHKRDLEAFGKRFKRKYPDAELLWVVELQKRGAPHYHVAAIGISYVDRHWLSQTWYEVVGSGDERHLRAGTNVQPIHTWDGVGAYLAKYLSKGSAPVIDPETGEILSAELGRRWGRMNRRPDLVQLEFQEILKESWYALRRVFMRCRKFGRHKRQRRRHEQGMTMFLRTETTVRLLGCWEGGKGL